MGCDIHVFPEKRLSSGEWVWIPPDTFNRGPYSDIENITVFEWRDYSVFGFLAGVRDTSIAPISKPRGVPEYTSINQIKEFEKEGLHTPSWLYMSELLTFNYGAPAEGSKDPCDWSYWIKLGPYFFHGLRECALHDVERIAFAFDS